MKAETFDSVWDGLADTAQEAASLKARSALVYTIRKVVKSWDMPPQAAAARLGLTEPRLGDLLRGRLTKFSLDELVAISESPQLSVDMRTQGARMDELVARVARAADISAEQADRAISLVFAFLRREAPDEADDMLREVPGAAEAAARGESHKPDAGGLLGGLMSKLGDGGGLIGLASQLTGIGLGTSEMTTVGREIFGFAREKAGDARVGKVAAAVPGLSQFV